MQQLGHVVQLFPPGIPKDQSPRGIALSLCQNMSGAFTPPAWPRRPAALYSMSPERLQKLALEWARGVEPQQAYERDLLVPQRDPHDASKTVPSAFVKWEMERASVEGRWGSVLRGAFWTVVTLRKAIAEDPSDTQSEEMLAALIRFLSGHYGIDDPATVSDSYKERDELARSMAALHRKNSR